MDDDHDDRGRSRYVWILGAVLGLLVLYVLSLGPAVAIVRRTGMGVDVATVVYAPLEWLYENTPLREPLGAYVEFWQR